MPCCCLRYLCWPRCSLCCSAAAAYQHLFAAVIQRSPQHDGDPLELLLANSRALSRILPPNFDLVLVCKLLLAAGAPSSSSCSDLRQSSSCYGPCRRVVVVVASSCHRPRGCCCFSVQCSSADLQKCSHLSMYRSAFGSFGWVSARCSVVQVGGHLLPSRCSC